MFQTARCNKRQFVVSQSVRLAVCDTRDYVMLVLPHSDEQLTLVLPRGGAWWGEINEA